MLGWRGGLVSLTVVLCALHWLQWRTVERGWHTHCPAALDDLHAPWAALGLVAEESHPVSRAHFAARYVVPEEPVVLRGAVQGRNAAFGRATQRGPLLKRFGHVMLTLSTANTASYDKTVTSLRQVGSAVACVCVFAYCSASPPVRRAPHGAAKREHHWPRHPLSVW